MKIDIKNPQIKLSTMAITIIESLEGDITELKKHKKILKKLETWIEMQLEPEDSFLRTEVLLVKSKIKDFKKEVGID